MALDELTSDEAIGDLLVVPLGATEQHGPHLPLGTDTIIATALAATLDAVVAPALPYGSSGEHAGFAGTLSIGREALERVLVELVRSTSFPRVLFVCAHGGNAEPLAAAVRRLHAEGQDAWAWSPRWDGDAHAGRVETSLLLALAPHLVGAMREPGNVEPLAALMPRLRAEGVRAVAPNGILGDPRGASADEGHALLAAAAADLHAFVAEHVRARRDTASPAGGDPRQRDPGTPNTAGDDARQRDPGTPNTAGDDPRQRDPGTPNTAGDDPRQRDPGTPNTAGDDARVDATGARA